jgi:S-methylmethionine-dependent homocysteine/selenocysteine methylase
VTFHTLNGLFVIDGDRGTELERRGLDVTDRLQSTRVLLEHKKL